MRATILPMAIIILTKANCGQYDSQGEYCDPSTASEVLSLLPK